MTGTGQQGGEEHGVGPILGREFGSSVPAETLDRIQLGTLRSVYRNVPFYKSPFDIALYLQLLSRLAPRTVVEIGTSHGGSALWFADMLAAQGIPDARVLSVDIEIQAAFTDPRIRFMQGDARRLEAVLTPELLAELPRPWLVVEDSSHHFPETIATLEFFHLFLQSGDYIVVEDGVVSLLTDPHYRQYQHGPNRGVSEFLRRHGDSYDIATELCDHYGYNTTYNPNGWLRRR